LTDKGIEFQSLDVGQDKSARDEMIEKSDQMGVPVVDIEGTIIVGFNQKAIEEELGI